MADPLTAAKRQATVKLKDATNNLAAVATARTLWPDDELVEVWRLQAISEAMDALALARELGIEPTQEDDPC